MFSFEITAAIEVELDSQIAAFQAARPRAFGDAGSKLDEVKYDTKLIAQRIRADIKHAQKLSPENVDHLPRGLKVSVRLYGHRSISMRVTVAPFAVNNPARQALRELKLDRYGYEPDFYTVEATRVLEVLERIQAQYNYNRSDIVSDYYDVNFSCRPDFASGAGLDEPVDDELLKDMNVMKIAGDHFLYRQLEALNRGREWHFCLAA